MGCHGPVQFVSQTSICQVVANSFVITELSGTSKVRVLYVCAICLHGAVRLWLLHMKCAGCRCLRLQSAVQRRCQIAGSPPVPHLINPPVQRLILGQGLGIQAFATSRHHQLIAYVTKVRLRVSTVSTYSRSWVLSCLTLLLPSHCFGNVRQGVQDVQPELVIIGVDGSEKNRCKLDTEAGVTCLAFSGDASRLVLAREHPRLVLQVVSTDTVRSSAHRSTR